MTITPSDDHDQAGGGSDAVPVKARVKRVKSPCGNHAFEVPKGAVYDQFRADRAVAFITSYCRHTKARWAGKPIELEPWQEWEIVRPLFGVVYKKTGLRWYSEALVGIPRKNAKSTLASAIALYLLLADGEFGAEVYSLAGDKKQAGLVFTDAAKMVRAHPLLRATCRVFRSVIEVTENGSIYRALSSDADLQHGLNPSAAIIDEYHVHRNSEQYDAMVTGTAAREQPLVMVITTAGGERRGPLWELLQRARAGTDPHLLFVWFGAEEGDDGHDPAVWRKANPASWVSDDFLARQHAKLPFAIFERLHLNRYPEASRAGAWLPPGAWDDGGEQPQIDPSLPSIVAVDAAPRRDKTAIVLVQRDADGVHHALCWSWRADPDLGYFDFEEIEQHLRGLAREFNVARMAFDPFAMQRSMQVLGNEGLPVEEFPQNHARMVPASMRLHEVIVERRIRHGGSPDLTEGIEGSVIRETSFGWRLDKLASWKQGMSNDAAVALAMAVQLAEQEAELGGAPTVIVV